MAARSRSFRETNGELFVKDSDALDAIAQVMSGSEWDAGTIEKVAEIVGTTGRTILDAAEQDDDEPAVTIALDQTDQQRVGAYLAKMNLEGKLNNFTSSLYEQLMRRGSLSDRQVAAVMRDIEKADRAAATHDDKPTVTEPGVYEKDGVIYVVKWNKEKTSLYAKQIRELNSTRVTEAGTVVEIEFDYVAGAVYKLAPSDKMPLDKAKEYTIRYGRCIVCGRDLKKAESVERGIGPICVKSFG